MLGCDHDHDHKTRAGDRIPTSNTPHVSFCFFLFPPHVFFLLSNLILSSNIVLYSQQTNLHQACRCACTQACKQAITEACRHTGVHAVHTRMNARCTSMHMCCVHASMRPCVHASMRPCLHASMRPCVHASMRPCVHASMPP